MDVSQVEPLNTVTLHVECCLRDVQLELQQTVTDGVVVVLLAMLWLSAPVSRLQPSSSASL